MKRILSIMWLLTCMTVGAYAQGDTLTISTATYCGVQVSTSAATRVDNKVTGGGTAVMNSRTHLKVCTKADNPTVFCGFDVNVSTQNTVNMGQAIPGSIYAGGMALCNQIELPSNMSYFCMSATTADGPWVHVEQGSIYKPVR